MDNAIALGRCRSHTAPSVHCPREQLGGKFEHRLRKKRQKKNQRWWLLHSNTTLELLTIGCYLDIPIAAASLVDY
jgi:hypothetical protein